MLITVPQKPKKTSSNVLFCTNQQSTTQRYSVYCHRLEKPENIHIEEAGIREFGVFLLKKDSKRLVDYQNSWRLIQ